MRDPSQRQTEAPGFVAGTLADPFPGSLGDCADDAENDGVPPAPLPVTFVSSHARRGGSERYLETLIEGLGADWVLDVVALEDGPFVDELRRVTGSLEIVPTSPRPWGLVHSAWKLRRLLRRRRPAVVHANGIKAALVTAMATVGTSIPVVWVKHDVSGDGWLAHLIAARCARVVAVSAFVSTTFSGRTRAKVQVIHNGIEPHGPDRKRGRRRLLAAISTSEPVQAVCMVGRLDPAKGHDELLSVTPQLASRQPGLRIVFIGGEDPVYPGYREILEQRAHELGVEEIVSFLGYRDDAKLLIAGCDVLVIASYANERGLGQEAFAFVGLEALVAGTPVVAYADGGIPELLCDCGVLVEPGNRTALREEIGALLGDRERRLELGRRGRESVRTRLSLERSVGALTRVYEAVGGRT